MGEPAAPPPAGLAATLALARAIVDSVRNDEGWPSEMLTSYKGDASIWDENKVFALAQLADLQAAEIEELRGRLAAGLSDAAPLPTSRRPWREVLGWGSPWPELPPDQLLDLVRARHRKLIKQYHPDSIHADAVGIPAVAAAADLNASLAAMAAELNLALDDADLELAGDPCAG